MANIDCRNELLKVVVDLCRSLKLLIDIVIFLIVIAILGFISLLFLH